MRQRLLILVLGWYVTSITLSLYNKWMFDPSKGLQIACPITVTSFHQFILWFFSFFYMKLFGWQKDSRLRPRSRKLEQPDWKFYLKYVVPTAVASAGDIGFANVSFKFVTLTIYTIIKSASIAFVLLFGCIFQLEQFHWKLAMIVLVMFSGLVMMVYKPSSPSSKAQKADDHARVLFGSLLVLVSSCLSGLRWVFTQLILRKDSGHTDTESESSESEAHVPVAEKPHPIHTINQLAPIMGFVLFCTALIFEKPFPEFWRSKLFSMDQEEGTHTYGSVAKGALLLMFPGFEVFLMTICEFGILQTAHVLTLSVAGIIKELLTVLCGVLFFKERLSGFHNWAGMSIVLLDVAYYNYFRYTQEQKPHHPEKDMEMDQVSVLYTEPCPDTAASYELGHVNNKIA